MDLRTILRFQIVWCVLFLYCEVNGALQSPVLATKQWNLLTYNFEYDTPTNDKNYYIAENVVATGIAVGYDRIFVATPRLFSGVPATFSSVPLAQFGDSPVLQAYPDWSFHTVSKGTYNCSDLGLVSVYRHRIDSCNRLWVLDAGVSRSLEDYEITCPPKILVFDLSTNQVVRRIDFPRQVRRGESLFTNLVIDETTSNRQNNCDDVFVYITDTVEPAIVVYDSARDLTWRVVHPSMYPDPDWAESNIVGSRFVLMDGVVGLAFDEKTGTVYYQPLATDRVFSVSKETLRSGPIPITQALPAKLVGRKSSQGLALAVSPNDGSLIFSPFTETSLASFNPNTNKQKVISYDPEQLQFVADMSLSRYDTGAVYVLSSKFQRYYLKTVNANEINTRILRVELPGSTTTDYFDQASKRQYTPYRLSGQSTASSPGYVDPYFKAISSPFPFLNAGEQISRKTAYPLLPEQLYGADPDFGNLNTLRFAKSVINNTTTFHY